MIKADNLTKFYGSKRALGPVTFEIGDGQAIGFLGLNGAGKTTALRILACDLRPSGGNVKIDKVDALATPHEVRKLVGFLPEHTPLYQDMIVTDYLAFAGRIRNLDGTKLTKRMGEVLELTNLTHVAWEPIRTLSHGYRQRVGVAQAIIHDPKFVILDEPTRGLDPVQIVDMRGLIKSLKQKHTVMISSHILPEIAETCDRALVLGGGAIIGQVELTAQIREEKVEIVIETEPGVATSTLAEKLQNVEGVTGLEGSASTTIHRLTLKCSRDVRPAIAEAVTEGGWKLYRLDRRTDLENIFLGMVQGEEGGRERN
jgi:ABC-2 type transport system ATP-binding protein